MRFRKLVNCENTIVFCFFCPRSSISPRSCSTLRILALEGGNLPRPCFATAAMASCSHVGHCLSFWFSRLIVSCLRGWFNLHSETNLALLLRVHAESRKHIG